MQTSKSLMQTSKKALRQGVSQTLRDVPQSQVQLQSEAVIRHLFASENFKRSKTVSCYLSMKGEIDTSEIVREILRAGKSLFVPKIANRKENRMDFLQVYSLEDLDSLPSGVWGIKEPDAEFEGRRRANVFDSNIEPLDMILVPGVAFDTKMSRLGHGKGYYDYFINNYTRTRPKPVLLALSLREQIVPIGEIPMAEHDRRMDAIVTPDGLIRNKTEVHRQVPEVGRIAA
ncbi:5-formyltetrahydrofolate cyclo-ligase [Fomitiporia mediterranea MF3/22]|uniref:5-formyltetrahydrofolate cyclo-ligase n=1 Tax=Fomitiporia mediterranea (strain MF3/22) TaxID=694068 RepID=R7SH88_FOMME|nr:5-formyltetrahydrofolate cyclo-ligase [Fomitiporia mediterranea MF3/22]EJC97745.1 5-formyltetrahydrofolate cyclo-ligase [Fomitiporia mediterranea MF3/22]